MIFWLEEAARIIVTFQLQIFTAVQNMGYESILTFI